MVERWFVKPRVVGSNPAKIAKDFVAQLERASAYEAEGYRFESYRGHN
jgi:hypothetical protein